MTQEELDSMGELALYWKRQYRAACGEVARLRGALEAVQTHNRLLAGDMAELSSIEYLTTKALEPKE